MQRKTFLADRFTGKTNEWTVKKIISILFYSLATSGVRDKEYFPGVLESNQAFLAEYSTDPEPYE